MTQLSTIASGLQTTPSVRSGQPTTPGRTVGPSNFVRRDADLEIPGRDARVNDTVELSTRRLNSAVISTSQAAPEEAASQARLDRLAQIRAEIEAGTYDTPEKLDQALDAMISRQLDVLA